MITQPDESTEMTTTDEPTLTVQPTTMTAEWIQSQLATIKSKAADEMQTRLYDQHDTYQRWELDNAKKSAVEANQKRRQAEWQRDQIADLYELLRYKIAAIYLKIEKIYDGRNDPADSEMFSLQETTQGHMKEADRLLTLVRRLQND